MAKKRISLTNRKQRSVLTDMLPFEVPPTFSNRGFYRFLRNNSVEIENEELRWICKTDHLNQTMQLLFGFDPLKILTQTVIEWGKKKVRYSVPIKKNTMNTVPFNFRIAHNLNGRILSVIHPRNQVSVAHFYATYSALIIYHTSISAFSIRHPVSVSQYAYFNDKLHKERFEKVFGLEKEDREYEQIGSYFTYKKYRNIYQFFESYQYHYNEKKYNEMMQVDISKCFDSIYTHSFPWATLGKEHTKFSLNESKNTFGGKFDVLMQRLNYQETNGIVIGPEFSRIFAEVILQSIDAELMLQLTEKEKLIHKIDYEIFRYVDDFFIFYNTESTQIKIFETLQELLKSKKLNINTEKIKIYKKPIITEITIAKERISNILNNEINPLCEEEFLKESVNTNNKNLVCKINTNRLIINYKAILKEVGVTYDDILSYTLGIIENKVDTLFKYYIMSDKSDNDRKRLSKALLSIMEFSFFIYSASPKVNHTIRLCRIITTSVTFLNDQEMPYEIKHLLFKYVYDNMTMQLEKNTMRRYHEIENLYLLISLSQIGKEYWLPVSTLLRFFLIHEDDKTKNYTRPSGFLNHFSITILLSYIKDKVRYKKLKIFIESHIISKMNNMKAHNLNDAETLITLLDLIVCPYISDITKNKIGSIFELDEDKILSIKSANDQWFTSWGNNFNLEKELDAKRNREVY